MKIAIASSGLGHISRGIETWARDTAVALHERGIEVTLFAGGARSSELGARSAEYGLPRHSPTKPGARSAESGSAQEAAFAATASRGSSERQERTTDNEHPRLRVVVLPCLRRYDWQTRWLSRLMPGFCWRWGWKRTYDIEQQTFWRHLKTHLRGERYDILHVQDPLLADLCRKARERGGLATKEILAHGTEEPAEFLARFPYVQHLAPWHIEHVLSQFDHAEEAYPNWFVSPNFVDTNFYQHDPSIGREFRVLHGIPDDAFVVGCAAAIKFSHKRLDYLIREFISATHDNPHICGRTAYLLLAGAWEKQSPEIEALVKQTGSKRINVLYNLSMNEMPAFYNALDMFVLPSLFEMLGIVLLEAMACQTPCVGHTHPVLRWVIDGGGSNLNLEKASTLGQFLLSINENWLAEKSLAARRHVVNVFSKEAVIGQYVDYYRRVLAG